MQDGTQLQAGIILARLYYEKQQLDKALSISTKLLVQAPDSIQLLLLTGNIFAASGQYLEARAKFEAILLQEPTFLLAKISLGKLLLAEGKVSQARAYYNAMLDHHAENVAILTTLSQLEILQNNIPQAIRHLERVRDFDAKNWRVRLELSSLYLRSDLKSKAFEMVLSAKRIEPKEPKILFAVANVAMLVNDVSEAKVSFSRLISLYQSDAKKLFTVASAQYSVGLTEDAIATVKLAIHYQSLFPEAEVAQATWLLALNRTAEAELMVERLKQINFEKTQLNQLLGDIAYQKGRYVEAIEFYRETPSDVRQVVRLYNAYVAKGDTDIALVELEQWVETHPGDLRITALLVEANLRLGRTEVAQGLLEFLVKKLPNQASLLNNLANIYAEKNDPRALPFAKKAYELDAEDASINDTLGWLLLKAGKPKEGLRYLRDAEYRASDSLEIRYHIAVALNLLQRHSESVEILQSLVKSKAPFLHKNEALLLLKKLTVE